MVNAVYGQKDAARDYHDSVDRKYVNQMNCTKLAMCSCIYRKIIDTYLVLVYGYVDDFVFAGTDTDTTLKLIEEFRKLGSTTEPVKNAEKLLGMELKRDFDRKIILVTMTKKIEELAAKYPDACKKRRSVPMPTNGYLVRDYELEEELSEALKRPLTTEEIEIYMSIVGSLIWIEGVRLDIIFAVLYLTWFTRKPLVHHLKMAYYVVGYLYHTRDMPLVLGGSSDIQVEVDVDASHGTAPKSRSVTGLLTKLHPNSGAVSAKSSAQTSVKLNTFESELDGITTGFKAANKMNNILEDMHIHHDTQSIVHNDNLAAIKFVQGEGVAKGVRHMELRMWYTREQYARGKLLLKHKKGTVTAADKLTKLGCIAEHRMFAINIQGLGLLGYDYYKDG
jgi:hypothetical protein